MGKKGDRRGAAERRVRRQVKRENGAGKRLCGRSVTEEIVGKGRVLYGGECGGLCRTVTGVLRR